MKKKIINGLMMVALIAATSASFVSCKDTNEDELFQLKNQLNQDVDNLQDQIDDLGNTYATKLQVKEVNDSLTALKGRVNGINTDLATAQQDIKDLQADIKDLQADINDFRATLEDAFKKLVYDVEISGVYNNMTGSINIPGFEPKMLINNYGIADNDGSFPKSDLFKGEKLEWVANDVLGAGELGNPGFAGYIYANINRYFEDLPMKSTLQDGIFDFTIATTDGTDVPGLNVTNTDENGKATTDVLRWGWTRDAENNVYKFRVDYIGDDASSYAPVKIDLSKFKADIKQVWQDRNKYSGTSKQALGRLVADLYYNLATKDYNMNKYLLKVKWTEDSTKLNHIVTSEAELVFAAIKPLFFFNSGQALGETVSGKIGKVNNLIDRSEKLWNKIFNKIKKQLPNLNPDQIKLIMAGDNLKIDDDGEWYIQTTPVGGGAAQKVILTDIIEPLNTDLVTVKDMLGKAQKMVDKLNGKTVTDWVEKFTNRFDKLFTNNADQMLQPVLLAIDKDGNVNRVSGLEAYPYEASGEITLDATTYTAELFAPAYAKFVGCKDITADGFNEIITSNMEELKFTPEKGKLYEIVYEAVDYSGTIVSHTYYIQGK